MDDREFGKENPDQIALDNKYFEIVCATRGKWRSLGFLRRILCFLRAHTELCKDLNYQRLYDECVYYLLLENKVNNNWTTFREQEQKEWLEFVIDLENKSTIVDKLPKCEVDAYLEYRKYRWKHSNE